MEKKEVQDSVPDFIKWFSEIDKNSGNVAGGKGANLAEIYNLRLPVPSGFVITAQAYSYFIKKAGIGEKIKEILGKIDYENTKQLDDSTKEIRNLILKAKMPSEMEKEIIEDYNILSEDKGNFSSAIDVINFHSEPSFVAVRSSATTEDLATASFAGQQDSFVNVKGNSSLIEHIKKCFASLFTSRATYYRIKKGFKHEQAQLAVVVQKMVDSEKSGVIFTKDPAYKSNNTIIEAVYGLGEGIVSGKISPDKYTVSENLEVAEKIIAEKKIAITRDSGGNKQVVKLSAEKSKSQVLKDSEIKKLAEYGLKLEEHYQKPQDIEFAIENNEIYIVQTRPITTIENRFTEIKEIKGEAILKGIAASPGIASGKIRIVGKMEDLQKIEKGDILVTKMTNPDMVVSMQKSAGIVTDEGGMTSHAAIVSREMGIPAVVGTQEATIKLKEGEIITVDGFSGKIYMGKVSESVEKEILPVVETKTKIKVTVDLPTFAERASRTKVREVGLTRIEGIIAESGKHPDYFMKKNQMEDYEKIIFSGIKGIAKYFDELWIRTSDIRADEYGNLEGAPEIKEANPMLGMHGIRHGLKNPKILKAELNALKRVSEENKKIGLLLPQLISVEEVIGVKKILGEIGFDNAKVGVMIETPASVEIIEELCREGIKFISFGTNDLTQYTLAIDRNNESVQYLYNEMNPAILHQLERVIRICKKFNVETSICGQAGSRKEMVEKLVGFGIDSISVNADAAHEISEFVAELEKNKPEKEGSESPKESSEKEDIEENKDEEDKIREDSREKDAEEKKEDKEIFYEPQIPTPENLEVEETVDEIIDEDSVNEEMKYNKEEKEKLEEREFLDIF
jgi:pyruvate,water dikinase